MQRLGLVVAGHLGVVAGSWSADHLQAIKAGNVPKSKIELVLAQHQEDIDWSEAYHNIRTVYCKGGARCGEGSIHLPNVGREGHTYLKHIVDNYDNLAEWTVFSQAEAPSDGYFGQGRGGGHLVSGVSFDDYLLPRDDSHFVLSSKVHLPSLQHSVRATFRTEREGRVPQTSSGASCPAGNGEDSWGDFMAVHKAKQFLSDKCAIEEMAFGSALEAYWDDFVKAPMPVNEVVHYAQGARFAVSRQRLQQRSKAYYRELLDAVSGEVDPCLSYLYEMSWYFILGPGQSGHKACESTDADSTAGVVAVRELQSGVSGGEGDDVVLTGSISIVVSADMIEDLLMNETFKDGIQTALNETLGVDKSYIEVTLSNHSVGRRLEEASGMIKVDYVITIPEAMTSAAAVDEFVKKLTPGSLDNGSFAVALSSAMETTTGIAVTVQLFVTPVGTNIPTTTSQAIVTDGAAEQGLSLTVMCGVTAAAYFLTN